MRLDPHKFKVNEEKSNPMVVAMEYPDCSIKEICFFMVVGFGRPTGEQCKYLKMNEERECLYGQDKIDKSI